jgi:hypothetical protein
MMVGALGTDLHVQTLQYYPYILNMDNVPEDTYELDEINQRFQF